MPSVVTAIGDDAYGKSMLEACQKRKVDTGHVTIVPGGQTAVIEMLLNGRDRVHHRAEKGVMIPYQPTGEDMDFIRTQDYIHTDLSWNVTGLLKDMRSKGTKIYFDFSKRYQHEDVPTILKNINYGIFSFEEETEEVRELLRMGCSMGAEVLLATFGEGGSLAFDGTEFYRQPCIPAPKMCIRDRHESAVSTHYGDELMNLGLITSDASSGQYMDGRRESCDFDSRLFYVQKQAE